MFKVIYDVIIFITMIYGLYFGVMGVFGFVKKKKKRKINDSEHYFAIIIAARNEAKVIKNLIDSLQCQNYDKNKYEIDVVVNNCTDNTEEIVAETGANILKCDVPTKTKGEVLKCIFKKLEARKDIDAYVIFDADNVVHPDFLRKFNDSLNRGYKVAQGFRDTKNLDGNWLSSCYALYYYLQNFFFNRARNNLNLSATINGTGFMIKKEVIDLIGFNTITLTEDMEFSGICAINKIKIDFVEDAITYDEQPTVFKQSWKQRIRWSFGNWQCCKAYFLKLIKHLFKDGNITCLDLFLLYVSPLLQIVSFGAISINFVITLIKLTTLNSYYLLISNNLILILGTYISGIVLSVFIIIHYKKSIKDVIGGIFLFFFFVATWIPINMICFFKKKLKWEPIKHTHNISIKEIVTK